MRDKGTKALDPNTEIYLYALFIIDWWKRQLQCSCFACTPDNGVPLGVVILQRATENGRTTCKLREIDARKRYRRWLKIQTCQRVRDVGLLEHLGQSLDSATKTLRARGVELKDAGGTGIKSFAGFHPVAEKFTMSINPLERKELRAHVFVDLNGVRRIIGFE
jgi:hypothetical protein